MKTKKLDALLVWKQIEDQLVPRLRLDLPERAVYYHLLRHSRLEGRFRLPFSIPWLARGTRLSPGTAREAVRRLIAKGALRLVERTRAGHVVDVRLPEEIRGACRRGAAARQPGVLQPAVDLAETDFLETEMLREAIHARERGQCFYCLRRVTLRARCLDHVVPRVRKGSNSYCNLVSSCVECNSLKGATPAEDFLRSLYRQRRLTAAELANRLRALDKLAAGELRPVLSTPKPKFEVGAPKPTPPSYKRFPVGSLSYPPIPYPPRTS